MRKVKFNGPASRNIGRFGEVHKGSTMYLTEEEWACVCDGSDFQLLGGSVNDEAKELAKGLLPFGTPAFDLRNIPWESSNLVGRLGARFSRRNLKDVIDAMRLIGAVVEGVTDDDEKIIVVDAIMSAAINMGWDTLGESVRGRLPSLESDGAGGVMLPEGTLEDILGNRHTLRRAFTAHAGEPQPRFVKNHATVTHFPAQGTGDAQEATQEGGDHEEETPQAPETPPTTAKRRKLKNTPRKRKHSGPGHLVA